MKRVSICIVLIIYMVLPVLGLSNESTIKELLSDGSYFFTLVSDTGGYRGYIACDDGVFSCGYEGTYVGCFFKNATFISNDEVCVSFLYTAFSFDRQNQYREWYYPDCFEVVINKDQVLEGTPRIKILLDLNKICQATCDAVIVTENLRIRDRPETGKDSRVLGRLGKYEQIKLYGETEKKDTIDGITAPWYKVKMSSGEEGWIFGGYAKIFFSDSDLAMIKKAFE